MNQLPGRAIAVGKTGEMDLERLKDGFPMGSWYSTDKIPLSPFTKGELNIRKYLHLRQPYGEYYLPVNSVPHFEKGGQGDLNPGSNAT